MEFRTALLGARTPRHRVLVVAVTIPLVASVAFLLGSDRVLGIPIVYPALALALFAGWSRAGALAGTAAVFFTVLWRFVVPPLVGYLRGSWDTRYTPPRVLGYKLDPRGELLEGITHGPVYALVLAVVLGGSAYLVGALLRRAVGSTNGVDTDY